MDKIEKALQKLSPKDRTWVKEILGRLDKNNVVGLDIKKLKGRDDIYRVRKGDIRIIYCVKSGGDRFVLAIEHRNEKTYKL